MKALVTGGGGFLGSAIVRRLKERGDEVRSLSRSKYPSLAALGVEQFQADLDDERALKKAAEGCDVVFHVAAKAGVWGHFDDYWRVNVEGTANVLGACWSSGVRRLAYTSSPSVVFPGRDVEGADESLPFPERYEAAYPATKAVAERLVLAANGSGLETVALRPHLIWGPGDNHLIPRIVARGRAGKLRKIGSRACLVDSIYIDNAAHAHLLAADRLGPGSAIGGKAYFVSQGEPVPVWDLVNRILAAAGVAPVTKSVPARVAWAAGAALEGAYRLLGRSDEPPMTRFLAQQLSTSHWFDISAARRDLGYEPIVSIDEGMERLKEWFRPG